MDKVVESLRESKRQSEKCPLTCNFMRQTGGKWAAGYESKT